MLAFLELVLPFCLDTKLYQTATVYLWLICLSILALFYTVTMIYLNSKMRHLSNFVREIRSVRLQFLLLLVTFTTHSTYELMILFNILNKTTAA